MEKKLLVIATLVLLTGCSNPDLGFDSIGLLGESKNPSRDLPQLGKAEIAQKKEDSKNPPPNGRGDRTQPFQEESQSPQEKIITKKDPPNLIQLNSEISIPKDKGNFTLSFENVGIRYSTIAENQLVIEGEIKNTSEEEANISDFKIIINLYDESDKLLETAYANPILSTLTGNTSSPFKLEINAVEGMSKYRLVGGY